VALQALLPGWATGGNRGTRHREFHYFDILTQITIVEAIPSVSETPNHGLQKQKTGVRLSRVIGRPGSPPPELLT
jgi:hypothetical protein